VVEQPKGASRRGEKRTRLAEDVIRSLLIAILALECSQSICVLAGRTGPLTGVLLGL
jgi:hypothetical protein